MTGPLESFDLAGQNTIAAFAEFLLPSLDTGSKPHDRYTDLLDRTREAGDASPTMCDWSERNPDAVAARRIQELFSRLQQDRAASGTEPSEG